jgi:hypothetical protein
VAADARARLGYSSGLGSKALRWALVEAAQKACQGGGPLRQDFERIAKRRGRRIAKVAIARKILTLCYYGLRDGEIRCLKAAHSWPACAPSPARRAAQAAGQRPRRSSGIHNRSSEPAANSLASVRASSRSVFAAARRIPVSLGLTTTTRATCASMIQATSQALPVTSSRSRSSRPRLPANSSSASGVV